MEPIVTTLRRDPEVMRLVADFATALPDLVREIVAAATRGDLPEVAYLAHRLKGSAAGYGFPEIREQAARVERRAGLKDLDGCRDEAVALRAMVRRVQVEPPW